ncbi:MAG: WD40 repeat domain-containing protein [Treponema sp.]|nr:WD40 repeat domain-containing protein [Treponema sp.]
MAQRKKAFRIVIIVLIFIFYFFLAARPVPRESILVPKWISFLGSEQLADNVSDQLTAQFADGTIQLTAGNRHNYFGKFIPFSLGTNFGYFDLSGQLILNRIRADEIYLSQNMWVEYSAQPSILEIRNIFDEVITTINNPQGYPVLLDDRIFILGSEQNTLSEIGVNGNVLWSYDFAAPLTGIDVKAGLVLTGSLDGVIEVFDTSGVRIFHFEPGGSRYEVILGVALSDDGSRIGVISGIDQQRFLLLERFGVTPGDFRVVYHEFLDSGFRRPVRILFVDDDRHIVFERTGGLGSLNIRTRHSFFIPLDGAIQAVEESGDQGYLFLVTVPAAGTDHSLRSANRNLVGIRFPQHRWLAFHRITGREMIFLTAPFESDDVFLGRYGQNLFVGGGRTLIAFELEEL